jgi:hypothetical protein
MRRVFIPESPFWFKNGIHCTPIPLFAASVKQFFHTVRPQRSEIGTHTAEIARYSVTFATHLLTNRGVKRELKGLVLLLTH